jgi:hypothetical protein
MQTETTRGDRMFAKFTIGAAKRTFVYAAEVRDEKVTTIATANFPPPKRYPKWAATGDCDNMNRRGATVRSD